MIGRLLFSLVTGHRRGVSLFCAFFICSPSPRLLIRHISDRWGSWSAALWLMAGIVAISTVFMFFLLPETLADNILYRRAAHLRQVTGDNRYYSPSEAETTENNLIWAMLEQITVDFRLSFIDPVILFINVHTISICKATGERKSSKKSIKLTDDMIKRSGKSRLCVEKARAEQGEKFHRSCEYKPMPTSRTSACTTLGKHLCVVPDSMDGHIPPEYSLNQVLNHEPLGKSVKALISRHSSIAVKVSDAALPIASLASLPKGKKVGRDFPFATPVEVVTS